MNISASPARAALVIATAAVLAGCGGTAPSSGSPGASADGGGRLTSVTVSLSNAGCVPDRASAAAGGITFHVVNDGGDAVSEVELVQDGRVLAEKENLAPGLSGDCPPGISSTESWGRGLLS